MSGELEHALTEALPTERLWRDPTDRVREEEGKLHYPRNLDADHDCGLLRRPLHGPHLHYSHHHHHSDHFLQRGHRDRERPHESPPAPLYQRSQLVLACHHHVLSLRRERDLLLQAHCSGRQDTTASCHAPPIHQLCALHYWYVPAALSVASAAQCRARSGLGLRPYEY